MASIDRKVTLTFDNGPVAGDTDRLLDILRDRGVKATFFVVGLQMLEPGNRRLAERAAGEGHWIGNHSMRHLLPFGLDDSPGLAESEIAEADRAIGALAHPMKFLRPPGKAILGRHILGLATLDHVVRGGYTLVTWNNIPGDAKFPASEWVPRGLFNLRYHAWNLIVLHDQHLAKDFGSFEAFLDGVVEDGWEIVQDFPSSCLPVVRGEVRHPLDSFASLDPGRGGER